MTKNHLKSIPAPKTWPIKRKENKYVLRPAPGSHSLDTSISLNTLIINLLGLAGTKKEAVFILQNKEVLVDGKRRKNKELPVGLYDVVSIKDIKKNYRVVLNTDGKLAVIEIDDKEAALKPCKITGKKQIKKKTQLNLNDGSNILIDKDTYKIGDTILIELPKKSIKEHIRLEKGNTIFLTSGSHKGETGKVEDVSGRKILYKEGSTVIETLRRYAFVIGKDKPIIKIK